MNLENVIVKYGEEILRKCSIQAGNKMASQMNVAADNVTSQCLYAKS